MSIAEGLSGIFEDPSLVSRANTWEQEQQFTQQTVFQNPQTFWTYGTNYFHFPQNSYLTFEFGDIGQLVFGYSSSSAQLQVVNYANGASYPISVGVKPASSAPTIASGTVYQNTSSSYQTLYIPITYSPTSTAAATAAVALGTADPPAAAFTNSEPAGVAVGRVDTITLRVPPQWYYSVTVTNATIGTVTQIQE